MSKIGRRILAGVTEWTDRQLDLGRGRAALEALVPLAAVSAWVWLEPWGRPPGGDLAFGVALGLLLLLLVSAEDFPSAETAGLGRGAFTLRPFGLSFAVVLPLGAAALAWGGATGRLYASPALARALLLYPFGALVQEAAVFVFALPRLEIAVGRRASAFAAALLFGAVHLPNPLLTVGGGLMVLAFSRVWRRQRSLPALALAHGVLGAVCDKAIHVSMRIGASYFQ